MVDYSIGDGMTLLHKAVKGGRYLAISLLLQHFKRKEENAKEKKKNKEIQIQNENKNDYNDGTFHIMMTIAITSFKH